MRYSKFLALPTMIATLLSIPSSAPAQVSINIGAAPVCPYGYYDFAPYNCAPYWYYGSEWFSGGMFIGAGPWFHGAHDFHGHVDNRFDPHHGDPGERSSQSTKGETSDKRTGSRYSPCQNEVITTARGNHGLTAVGLCERMLCFKSPHNRVCWNRLDTCCFFHPPQHSREIFFNAAG